MIIVCSANPAKTREIATIHEKRSLFRDVIESLRIRSQLPEDINQNDENNLSQNYERYGYENEPLHLPSDAEYIPRRNDRIEMPSLKYRFPKNMNFNSNDKMESKEQVVLFIDSHAPKFTTQKPKRDKTRPRPIPNKGRLPNKNKENEAEVNTEPDADDNFPYSNTMAGQSQIGNRESQTVVKPTVIVNIRGSVTNRDSDIRLEARDDDNSTVPLQNIFNINQEVKIGTEMDKRKDPSVKQEIKLVPVKGTAKVEEDMMMCETATWKPDKTENRKMENMFQILFSI